MAERRVPIPNPGMVRVRVRDEPIDNLSEVQHYDPLIEKIVTHAPHVTISEMDWGTLQWRKAAIKEGSFFIVKRQAEPRFQILILNRRSSGIVVEDLSDVDLFDVNYLQLLYLHRNKGLLRIICFDTEEVCRDTWDLLSKGAENLEMGPTSRYRGGPRSTSAGTPDLSSDNSDRTLNQRPTGKDKPIVEQTELHEELQQLSASTGQTSLVPDTPSPSSGVFQIFHECFGNFNIQVQVGNILSTNFSCGRTARKSYEGVPEDDST